MKLTLLALTSIFLLSINTINLNYDNGQIKYKVEIDHGILNGEYISWYKNGKIKAKGKFKNNQRVGEWKVYDSLGQTRMVRAYSNSFHFSYISAKNEKGEDIPTPNKSAYERNNSESLQYPEVENKDVVITKRIWRTIEANSENNVLFEKNILYNILLKNIIETKKLIAFTSESDEFEKVMSISEVKNKTSKNNFEIVGYKVKEDWHYNSNWQLSENRIIGICPVIKDKNSELETDLFWVPFTELIPLLEIQKTTSLNEESISNIFDVFHFRFFNSTIYKDSNVFDYKISDYKNESEINDESKKIEMELIDIEHDLWIKSTEMN